MLRLCIGGLLFFPHIVFACLQPPLPTYPTGPKWSTTLQYFFYESASGGFINPRADVTIWRHECPNSDPLVLVTYQPSSMPEVCTRDHRVSSGLTRISTVLLTDPSDSSSEFCDYLIGKKTFVLRGRDGETLWDTKQDFTLELYESAIGQRQSTLFIDAYNPQNYDGLYDLKPISGELTGSWYDPENNGEGFVLEVSDTIDTPTAVLYWFTYRDGVPYWLIGVSKIEFGQSTIAFDLLEFSGTGVGADFNSESVDSRLAGSLNLQFQTCTSGYAAWATSDGKSGDFELRRITAGIEDVSCQD